MLTYSMTSQFIESYDKLDKTSTLRKTRQSTKKLVGDTRFELKDIITEGDEHSIATFEIDGRQLKITFDHDVILKVSCPDCTGK